MHLNYTKKTPCNFSLAKIREFWSICKGISKLLTIEVYSGVRAGYPHSLFLFSKGEKQKRAQTNAPIPNAVEQTVLVLTNYLNFV